MAPYKEVDCQFTGRMGTILDCPFISAEILFARDLVVDGRNLLVAQSAENREDGSHKVLGDEEVKVLLVMGVLVLCVACRRKHVPSEAA